MPKRGPPVLSYLFTLPVAVVPVALLAIGQDGAPPPSTCRPVGQMVRVPELPEASGVAASHRTPGVFWAHNDSGEPVLIALDVEGRVIGRVRVTGAKVEDWEDIAVGPCPQGSCIYVADIGDNDAERDHITVYRVAEPQSQDAATAPVEVFEATYPDGAHDAEAMFVTPQSDVFIITKGDPGPVSLYRFPGKPGPGRKTLERTGAPVAGRDVASKDRPTAANSSPDGHWVAVRTTHHVAFYRSADLTTGRWRETLRVDVSGMREPRGEGITFEPAGVVLVGEGGGSSRPGTFARLACTFPQ